jgi:hypothetical protein
MENSKPTRNQPMPSASHRPADEPDHEEIARGACSRLASLALIIAVCFAAGCATSGSGSRPPQRGEGLREYQQLVAGLHQAVTASRKSVETLAAATQGRATTAFAQFDTSLQRLEVVSIKARARADAMEQRGEAYFEEWAEEISGAADEASRRAAKARFAELHQHFEAILNDSRQVRQAFRPYLEGLRRLRTTLGPKPTFATIETAKPEFAPLVSGGRQAEEKMEQLLKTLKTAEAAVMAGPMPPMKSGGKR